MMVIFLTGLVAMILMRTLRADYARYTARDEDDLEVPLTLTPCPVILSWRRRRPQPRPRSCPRQGPAVAPAVGGDAGGGGTVG